MRIVVLIWDFSGAGAERVAVTLANEMKRLGHEVVVVAGRPEGPFRCDLSADIPLLAPSAPGLLRSLLHLRATLEARRPDVLLSHLTTRNVLAILAHLISPGRRSRIVVGVEHGEMAHTSRQTRGAALKAYFLLARALYPLADGLIAVSENVARSIVDYLRPASIAPVVLPNPIVFPKLLAQAAEAPLHPFFHDAGDPVFVAIGRLEAQKNYSLLLEAFALLVREAPARLVVYGEGKLRERLLAERDALGLRRQVDFAGFTANPFAEMRAAAALVISSIWEGLPTVAVEALACGAPIVSTDNCAGIRQILADGELGWITPPGDAAALARAMGQALTAPRNREALATATRSFEAGTVTAQYLRHFDFLAALRRGSQADSSIGTAVGARRAARRL